MFIHTFQYTLKQLFRQKGALFWNLLFPIALGTMFYMAFSGLSSGETFHAIPVAVVLAEDDSATMFREVIDSLNEPGDDRFLDAVYTTEEEALSLLEAKQITGILYEGSSVSLAVSAEMSSATLEQSILSCFVEEYNMQYGAIKKIAASHPENLGAAAEALAKNTAYNTETTYCDGDMDEQITYFFNLIAMSCLFASTGGMQIAIKNQANLSPLGARRCISPVPKEISLCALLCATFLYQYLCILAGLFYMRFGLGVNFGSSMGYILLTALLGCLTGVSFGFCIGSIGRLNEGMKFGIQMAVTMICCFLSGLMVGNMRILIEQYCPWFNRINPAALISDSFYSLTVYQSHSRYFQNSITLVLISAAFCLCGFLLTRRKKYAAL